MSPFGRCALSGSGFHILPASIRNAKGSKAICRKSGEGMMATVSEAFRTFGSRLEISELQQSTVSKRQDAVRSAVGRRFRVQTSFLTGSYRRHTMIAPLSKADVDIFIVLDAGYFETNGQNGLLDAVRRGLKESYPSSPRISGNGQAVSITFTDFVVDVVPAFNRRGGGFLIPSATEGRWIETDPRVHERFISAANAAHGGALVPLIKMVKAWSRHAGSRLHSFYLELMVERILRGVHISDWATGATYVFGHAREAVKERAIDPAGFGTGQVAGIAKGSVQEASRAFSLAHSVATDALAQDRSGLAGQAVTRWRQIFGDPFPAN